jgi:hypothetical protein
MLYREQWTKPSLEDFIAWLEMKDPEEEYQWSNMQTCACGQYAASIGVEEWNKRASEGSKFWNMLNN